MFMLQYANKENDFMKYALVLQDGFSKRIWLEALKDKTSEESIRAFTRIFKRSKFPPPALLQTDQVIYFLKKIIKNYHSLLI